MKKISFQFCFLLLVVFSFLPFAHSQVGLFVQSKAQKLLQTMTLEEKIAQLIIIRIHSNKDANYNVEKIKEITKYQPGGVCFFQGGPIREINLTNAIQKVSKIPLIVSIDAEWGVAMRLDSVPVLPRQMTMGALSAKNDSLIYLMGKEVANQCKLLGIHLNFAPCVDINNNAKNPVINSRSFGENRELVVDKSLKYLRGMQDNGLIACAKHFPGHGDTETDSHFGLPVISKTKKHLIENELYPFQKMIDNGCEMIMISHLNIPALDSEAGSIATTSKKTVTDLLRNEMGFNGLIITDGMEMEGLRKTYPNGADAEIKCLLAGIDILLLPNELKVIIPLLKKAVEQGIISEKLIDEKCLKVLQLKEKWGVLNFQPLSSKNVIQNLQGEKVKNLIKTIETKALTLVKNDKSLLPLKNSEKACFLFIGDAENENFAKKICTEFSLPFIKIDKNIKKTDIPTLIAKFGNNTHIITVYLSTNQTPSKNYGITNESVAFLEELGKNKKLIFGLFGNPYALAQFKSLHKFDAVIVGYQRTENSVRAALSGIFGKAEFEGTLPVSVLNYKAQTNYKTETSAIENDFFLPTQTRRDVDAMMEEGVCKKIFPGAQLLVLKNGKTFYKKNYGFTAYTEEHRVNNNTLYDVASLTKPLATTLALMKLYDEKRFLLKDTIGKFVAWVRGTEKSKLRIEELLTHTSGLPAFIPFYNNLLPDSIRNFFLNNSENELFNVPVAANLFLNSSFQDSIRKIIKEAPLKPKKYVYSDLGFVLLKEMIENITSQHLESYLEQYYYEPLKLKHTLFNPVLNEIKLEKIAPTEKDTVFRKQLVQGYVHDQTSALFGGNAGNAGLFSNAEEIGIILEMLMNGGDYEGKRYVSQKTISIFTSSYFCNGSRRRALGFDTPNAEKPSDILPSNASSRTFGHQGFTGTVFWCDPTHNLIYIFLSNRVNPNVEPNNLSKSKLRLLVHEKFY